MPHPAQYGIVRVALRPDCPRRDSEKTTVTDRFRNFLFYIAFFPQFVADPVVRAKEFLYQTDQKRSLSWVAMLAGLYLCMRGYFFKLVVTDNLAPIVDTCWKSATSPTADPSNTLILVFLFSMQIFADFLGYTDIARGVAYVLGFRLPLNFRSPYIASTFSDFWRRWQISLSSWLAITCTCRWAVTVCGCHEPTPT